ncbi:Imelysin [Zhouia amylolytica]|uniref:Imelysin n=1 Tax=Zhouia amylolytica TaxID=376730 RepID=A0A1I6UZ43_9FLAO|nr:imelysin family protein [Zhouia amylolytica]MCQ0110140.1 imelysin family protein [Zhouia amylolytica]SFT06710.1 Imelysin [Zhouia amylolytica]
MKRILLFLAFAGLVGCSSGDDSDGGNQGKDSFDRQAMLINWADNIIIPAYENYTEKLATLNAQAEVFVTTPDESNLNNVRVAWLEAYRAFQYVGMYEIGKAEELKLHSYSNIYPTQVDGNAVDADGINQNIASGSYDLTALSNIDEQGFPALDYMLHGIAETDTEIVNLYLNGSNYKTYLTDLSVRLKSLADAVLADWKGTYRDNFINNKGNTATSSTNKLVNDFIYHFEKNLRAGKIGIPAGVFSGGTILPEKVEGYYRNDVSKLLLLDAIDAANDFFNGRAFASGVEGASLKSYLEYLNDIQEGNNLALLINVQFSTAKNMADQLSESISAQVQSDNSVALNVYDELQRNVVYFKVDMLSAMSINVDYVDADGD